MTERQQKCKQLTKGPHELGFLNHNSENDSAAICGMFKEMQGAVTKTSMQFLLLLDFSDLVRKMELLEIN
jgi:hypothetical protein